MKITEARIGLRAKFVGKDHTFHNGEREGKVGTIAADCRLDPNGSDFGNGCCFWQLDGDPDGYMTDLEYLEAQVNEG